MSGAEESLAAGPAAGRDAEAQSLSGMAVLEVASGIACALAGRLLAGYGATVTRIEPPDGDPLRHHGIVTPQGSAAQLYFNAGKSMKTLDLSAEPGRAQLAEHIGQVEHVLTDFPAAARAELGLEGDEFRARHPTTTLIVVTPYGGSGPQRDWQATDLTSFASGGQMALTGEPDREPLKNYGNQAESQAAFHAINAVLLAQLRRMRGGPASIIDISVQEVQASALEMQGPTAFNGQVVPGLGGRTGNGSRALWSQYRCRDGYVGVFINPPNLKALFALLGHPEMLARMDDEEFLTGELRTLVTDWCAARTKQEVFEAAIAGSSPLSYVASPADILNSETIAATGLWLEMNLPGHGPIRVPGSPFSSTEMHFRL